MGEKQIGGRLTSRQMKAVMRATDPKRLGIFPQQRGRGLFSRVASKLAGRMAAKAAGKMAKTMAKRTAKKLAIKLKAKNGMLYYEKPMPIRSMP